MDFPGISKLQMEEKLLRESYKNLYILVFSDFVAVIFFALLLWDKVSNHKVFILWLVIMFVLNHLSRAGFLITYYRRLKANNLNVKFWKNYYIFNNMQSGILWALGGLIFFYVDDPLYRLLIFLFLTGLVGAPSAKIVTFTLAYLGFMIPIALVMLLISIQISSSVTFPVFMLTILYFSIVFFSTADAHQLLIKSIYLELYSSSILSGLKRSEENFRNTIENAPIGMAIISIEGKCLLVNRTLQDILGYSENELRNLNILQVTYPDDVAITKESMNKILKGEMRISHLENRYIRKDESIIWGMVSMSLIRGDEGKPLHFIFQMRDVSDRIKSEEKMRKLNEKTMQTLNELKQLEHDENLLNKLNRSLQICITSSEAYPRIKLVVEELFPDLSGGLSVFDKATNQIETIIQWGQDQLLPKEFSPMDCFAIREGNINVVDDPSKAVPCSHYLSPPEGGYMGLPLIVQNELIGVFHLIAPAGEKLTQHQQDMALAFTNIVKLALANINLRSSLSELSLHDPLTGLYNRRYLNEVLSREFIRMAREKNKLCVAMLDIDNFKRYNDIHGHLAGDEALKLIGEMLKQDFRGSDIAFRFGGEEFVIVLLNASLADAVKRVNHFREKLKNTPIYYKGKQLPSVTISIGVAEAPQHGIAIDDILRASDHALYAAKQAGKDCVKAFDG